jgi:hypothetical protein
MNDKELDLLDAHKQGRCAKDCYFDGHEESFADVYEDDLKLDHIPGVCWKRSTKGENHDG